MGRIKRVYVYGVRPIDQVTLSTIKVSKGGAWLSGENFFQRKFFLAFKIKKKDYIGNCLEINSSPRSVFHFLRHIYFLRLSGNYSDEL